MLLKPLIVLHRWLGVALCVLFMLWFPSGIGMMYWGMPSVTTQDRLDRMPALDAAAIVLSPEEAAEKIGQNASPSQIRLSSFDRRPVYRFGGEGGRIVYADNGEEHVQSDHVMRDRVAAAWAGQPLAAAALEPMGPEPDQWTVGSRLRNLRPLWKYSWPDGQNVYIGESGEVLLHTTRGSRLRAYLSAVPHWLYFTPLRKHQPVWIRFATYSAMVGVGASVIGMAVAIWMYSPARKKYRYAKAPSAVPYRGTKRLHTIIGLVFGVITITWTLSGSLAFLPFPPPQQARPAQTQGQQEQGQGQRQRGQVRGRGGENNQNPGQPAQQGQGQGRRGGGNTSLASSLRGQVRMKDFAALGPREVLTRFPDLKIKELSYTSYNSRPLYSATLPDGSSRLISLDGRIVEGFDREEIIGIVRKSVPNPEKLEVRIVEQYDAYYQDRDRRRPLPVILALTGDAEATRYYIDPKTASVVGNYSNRNWVNRWLYHGLHSLNFPFLYNHRPLWDIVVITFMIGGTVLSMTSLILAWRAIGKKLRQIVSVRQHVPRSKSSPASAST
jgi:hypothetical protein